MAINFYANQPCWYDNPMSPEKKDFEFFLKLLTGVCQEKGKN